MFESKKANRFTIGLLILTFLVFILVGNLLSLASIEEDISIKESEVMKEEKGGPLPQKSGIEVGEIAPDFTLPNFHSVEEVRLSDYEGKKVILNFFASWCPFCQKEAPDLEKINLTFGEDVQVITVNLTASEENPEDIDAYLNYYKVTSPVAIDFAGEVADLYQITSTPTNYFINSDGTISDVVPGAIDYEAIKGKIEKMK